jgi:mxaJ protein
MTTLRTWRQEGRRASLTMAVLAALAGQRALAADPQGAAAGGGVPAPATPALRVCVDPDNLPWSNADGRGFEPRVAAIVAQALGRPLQLVWQPMRRGFVRKTLGAHRCDVLAGVPAELERVLVTRPYYRSTYVIVQRADLRPPLAGFDDPRLSTLRIGVQLIGNDLAASPPGHALARHGAIDHVTGFTVDGGDTPVGERMVDAVARHDLDAAFAWGPQVGWFAHADAGRVNVRAAAPPPDLPLAFDFAISMAVRPGDKPLRDQLQAALDGRRADIDAALAEYDVPRVDLDDAGDRTPAKVSP